MLATGATSSRLVSPVTIQVSAPRFSNSRLIAEISANVASRRTVSATRRRTAAASAAGMYRRRLPVLCRTVRNTYGPCSSPRAHRQPGLPHRRRWMTSAPRSTVSRVGTLRASRARRAPNCLVLSLVRMVFCTIYTQDIMSRDGRQRVGERGHDVMELLEHGDREGRRLPRSYAIGEGFRQRDTAPWSTLADIDQTTRSVATCVQDWKPLSR